MKSRRALLVSSLFLLLLHAAVAQESHERRFGLVLGAAGDLDNDSVADFLISDVHAGGPEGSKQSGAVWAYSGRTRRRLYEVRGKGLGGDFFGASLSAVGDLDGDGSSDLAIGAPQPGKGAGYVRLISGKTGGVLADLTGHNPGDYFGCSIAGIGDIDGDKITDIAVGASQVGGEEAGFVVVLSGASLEEVYLVEGGRPKGCFGNVVVDAGDIDGDGRGDFVVGAPGQLLSSEGLVSVISGGAGEVIRTHSKVGRFGSSIDNSVDVDGDGVRDYVVGAPYWPRIGLEDQNQVFGFSGISGRELFAVSGERVGDGFGEALCVLGRDAGEELAQVVIGAHRDTVGIGALWIVDTWGDHQKRKVRGEQVRWHLGISVTRLGDIDGDDVDDYGVGAVSPKGASREGGTVLIYSGRDHRMIAELHVES